MSPRVAQASQALSRALGDLESGYTHEAAVELVRAIERLIDELHWGDEQVGQQEHLAIMTTLEQIKDRLDVFGGERRRR